MADSTEEVPMIRPRDISGRVYLDLRRRIVQLALEPGSRLREQALAEEYGISRTPIRRILDRLANDGLVTMSPGVGASVSVLDLHSLSEVWAIRMKVTELIGDVIQLPPSPETQPKISALVIDSQRASVSHDELVDIFDTYHMIMLELMPAGPVRRVFDQMYAQTARMFATLLPRLDSELERSAIFDEIEEFARAVDAGDADGIAQLRLRYLQSLLGRINGTPFIRPLRT